MAMSPDFAKQIAKGSKAIAGVRLQGYQWTVNVKRKSNAEGIVLQCKRAQAFIPASEQRYWDNRRRERKARKRAEKEARRAEW